jgi:hypothetical protein
MSAKRMPGSLRESLGDEAAFGLLELLGTERAEWSDHVLNTAADRFERRLAEEIGSVRVELHTGLAAVHAAIATARAEHIKWSFVFWIGQVAAMAGLLAFMLRGAGR